MKILHVHDTAGSASIMAQYQRKLGHDVKVITNKKSDRFKISEYYKSHLYDGSSLGFYLHVLKIAKSFDILHIHSLVRITQYLKTLYPKKKIILQFHGSDLRLYGNTTKTISGIKSADVCLLTTKDLWNNIPLKYQDKFIESLNIHDANLFNPNLYKHIEKTDNWLSFIETGKWNNNIVLKDKHIDIMDRKITNIPYHIMPSILAGYEGFIDVKVQNNKPLESLSRTGLEALSMGLKVMNWKGEILTQLPKEHNPYHVCNELNNIITDDKQQVITQ